MTDFFGELEGHLLKAARRRARRGRLAGPAPRLVLTAVATVAAAVAIFAALSTIDGGRDAEVVTPPPARQPSGCDAAAPPERLLAPFEVLRRPGPGVPERIAARLSGDLPGGRLAKVWPEHGRLARESDGRSFYLVPALAGTCEDPQPAICHVVDDGEVPAPGCTRLDRLGSGELIYQGTVPGGRDQWMTAAVVPDGPTPRLSLDGMTVTGRVEGNVFVAGYKASAGDHQQAELQFGGPPEQTECNRAPQLVDEPPDVSVRDRMSMFADVPLDARVAKELWAKALVGRPVDAVNHTAGRDLGEHEGVPFYAVPYSRLSECELPEMPPGGAPEDAPGVCVVIGPPNTEYGAACFGMVEIVRGRALAYTYLGDDRVLAYAVVPDGTRRATLDGRPMDIEQNMAYVVRATLKADERPVLVLER